MSWIEDAIKNLRSSLYPVKVELNELDWKSGLSEKSERLAQHISAFANQVGGGTFAFGVNNDSTLIYTYKRAGRRYCRPAWEYCPEQSAYPHQVGARFCRV